ncbi:MFS general substrate transporter [Ephemerocybe angulata]|uniref:MFS general substrate transporter n=1 Tax=Ephemerocybe angulata TaxID=980116 RepID=A0A8H6LZX7_9AGAR|nr:MFS general substrate transporter [Tulosesus angulatus]
MLTLPRSARLIGHNNSTFEESTFSLNLDTRPVLLGEGEQDHIIVSWEDGDPENPHSWSRSKRWYITTLSSVLVLNATFASSAPTGVIPALTEHLKMSHELGFGRKPIFAFTFLAYTLFQVGNALAKNSTSVLIFRLLGGIFAAAPLSNSGAVIGDVWDARTRGKALALFTLAPFAGPAMGPAISGYFMVFHVDWRWVFWLLSNFISSLPAGLCFALIVFTLPETYGPILRHRKAERLRKATGDTSPLDVSHVNLTRKAKDVLLNLFQPFRVLAQELMLVAITAYMRLMLLNLPIGASIGVIIYLLWVNPRYERAIQKHSPHPVPPEIRLEMALVGTPLFAISFFWFGWTSYPSIPFVVPLLSGVVMGLAICLIFIALVNYIVDAYLLVAASALAANTVFRSMAGAAFPLFAKQMFEALNPRWASTVLGLVATVMMPLPFLLIKYGPKLRRNSKYAPYKAA